MIKNLQFLKFFTLTLLGIFAFQNSSSAQCYGGDLQTLGTVNVALMDSFDLEVINDTIPTGGGFAWLFDATNTDGTGGPGANWVYPGQPTSVTYTNDLDGILSANNFPLMQGTWIIRGSAHTDPMDPFGSTCHVSTDSLIVIFDGIECSAGTMTTIGNETVCKGDSYALTSMDVEPGGGFGWFFDNASTGGTGALDNAFILLNADADTAYDEDLNGILSTNNLPIMEGSWSIRAASYTNPNDAFNTICSMSEDSLIVFFNPEITVDVMNNMNLEVVADATGGTAPFEYLWSNGEMGSTATDLVDGELICVVTDANGCTSQQSINLMNTSTDEVEGLENFEIVPNPAVDMTILNMTFDESQEISIMLIGLDGKVVSTIANEISNGGSYQIDLSNLTSGVYLIQVITEKTQFAERVVVR